MSLSDELNRLAELHQRGALTDEEFARAKRRLLDPPPFEPIAAKVNGLCRSRSDRWIAGVCGGLAAATGLESWAWRLAFALLLVFGGAGLVFYLLLWLFVPLE
jgi:phage shock protein C